jgi:hypothetical protein
VAATELDRDQLEQVQDQVAALLAAMPPRPTAATTPKSEHRFGPYPYLRVRVNGRHRSISLKALAQATRAAAAVSDGQDRPSA